MASIFEEIANLDRPFVPVMVNFGGKLHKWQARRPNSLESDAIDAYYSDEYAKLIVKKTESEEDKPSELDQMRTILGTTTREAIIEQLLGTRKDDVDRATLNKIDFNPAQEQQRLLTMSAEEQEVYTKERQAEFKAAAQVAREEIKAEYDVRDTAELVEILAQINLNMKCLMEAHVARAAMFIYFTLYDLDGERICPSVEAIREKFTSDTIRLLQQNIEAAFALAVRNDLPFASPDVDEPNKPPTSANTSELETTQSSPGGTPTRRRRKSSKQSS